PNCASGSGTTRSGGRSFAADIAKNWQCVKASWKNLGSLNRLGRLPFCTGRATKRITRQLYCKRCFRALIVNRLHSCPIAKFVNVRSDPSRPPAPAVASKFAHATPEEQAQVRQLLPYRPFQ